MVPVNTQPNFYLLTSIFIVRYQEAMAITHRSVLFVRLRPTANNIEGPLNLNNNDPTVSDVILACMRPSAVEIELPTLTI